VNWLPKSKVVVPVDFSDDSLAAIATALQLVADPSHVTVIHVLPEVSTLEPTEGWQPVDAPSRIRRVTGALRERLDKSGYAVVKLDVQVGDPGHEIADMAAREGAELIVLPSHGRTGLKRLLIGSVAERVVRLAHCPVLVLRK
jgi:nucleotide-binding universal stress UspA family protein